MRRVMMAKIPALPRNKLPYNFSDKVIPLQKPLKDLVVSTQDIKESLNETNDILSYRISKIEQELSQLTFAVKHLSKVIEKKSIFN